MFQGARSAFGLIGLIGGAGSAVIGLISFFGEGSWEDFFFWMGVAFLVFAGAAVAFLLVRLVTPPDPTTPEVQPLSGPAPDAGIFVVTLLSILLSGIGLFMVLIVVEFARGDAIDWRLIIVSLGVGVFLGLGSAILSGAREIGSFIRAASQPSRPCPRCGHAVRRGVMKCPSCHFDFWSVGSASS